MNLERLRKRVRQYIDQVRGATVGVCWGRGGWPRWAFPGAKPLTARLPDGGEAAGSSLCSRGEGVNFEIMPRLPWKGRWAGLAACAVSAGASKQRERGDLGGFFSSFGGGGAGPSRGSGRAAVQRGRFCRIPPSLPGCFPAGPCLPGGYRRPAFQPATLRAAVGRAGLVLFVDGFSSCVAAGQNQKQLTTGKCVSKLD